MFNKYFLKERLKKKIGKKNGETRDWIIQHPRAQRTISLAISHHLRMDMVSEHLKILFIEPKLIKVQKGDPRSYPLVSSASLARNLLWEVEAMLLSTPLSTPPAPSSCDPEEPPSPEDTAQSRVLLPLTGRACDSGWPTQALWFWAVIGPRWNTWHIQWLGLCSQCRGPMFDPCWENEISHAASESLPQLRSDAVK